jgi:hypothetical protein
MATYYVGIGGNDGADGTTWANRKLTLNGAEDIPVAAADTVIVGPGTYRETLTCDVNGSADNPITYIGDVTGEHTDGVGGYVRITGSDNDTTGARTKGIANVRTYRTFRGFWLDGATTSLLEFDTTATNGVIEECIFGGSPARADWPIFINGASPTAITIRRCVILPGTHGIYIYHSSDTAASSVLVENCLVIGCYYGVYCNNVSGVVIRNCTFMGSVYGVRTSSLAASSSITVNNSLISGNWQGMNASAAGEIVEDYNNVIANDTDRTNVTAGANSTAYIPYFLAAPLLSGYVFPAPPLGALAPWCGNRAIAGTSEAADDLYGVTRPTTSAKKSWGAVQYQPVERETTTTYDSSAASLEITNEGRAQ